MKYTFSLVLSICALAMMHAQSKKDLLAEVETLKQQLNTTKEELNTVRQSEKSYMVKVESLESQNKELKESNTSLLTNMGSFTELSKKKTQNLENSLLSLKEKDKQLNVINEAIAKADSTKLATLQLLKQAVGENADSGVNIAVGDRAVSVTLSNTFLFGDAKNDKISEDAKATLEGIGKVLTAKSDLNAIIQGNTSAGSDEKDNWDRSAKQAVALATLLQTDHNIEADRIHIEANGAQGPANFDNMTLITLMNTTAEDFYKEVKSVMKDNK